MRAGSLVRTGMLSLWPVAFLLVLSACSSPVVEPQIERPVGIEIKVVMEEVPGPTQIVPLGDGTIVAGLINGPEGDSTGQIVRLDPMANKRTVLYEGLDRPTGIAVVDEQLFVLEATRLSHGPLAGGELLTIADELPNNGRSQGTMSAGADGTIIFNTSGSRRGAEVREGSGRLWSLAPSLEPSEPLMLAGGYKNAYAHAADGEVLWTTEIGDGTYDGAPPADEVVRVQLDGGTYSGGWPLCVGDNRPVIELGAADEDCVDVPPSRAVFDPGATPTGLVVSPFDEDQLLVALWVTGQIVSVPKNGDDPTDWTVWASGLANPQHLAVLDGELYVSEFGADRILKFTDG